MLTLLLRILSTRVLFGSIMVDECDLAIPGASGGGEHADSRHFSRPALELIELETGDADPPRPTHASVGASS
jgi:hypothetical protein